MVIVKKSFNLQAENQCNRVSKLLFSADVVNNQFYPISKLVIPKIFGRFMLAGIPFENI